MKRQRLLKVRLSESEYSEIQTKATSLGIPMAEYARAAAINRRSHTPRINREAILLCQRINQSLVSIARANLNRTNPLELVRLTAFLMSLDRQVSSTLLPGEKGED